MRHLAQSEHCDLGLNPDADRTPDLRPEKELPSTSTAKHQVEGTNQFPQKETIFSDYTTH